jgi:hypothetical protein
MAVTHEIDDETSALPVQELNKNRCTPLLASEKQASIYYHITTSGQQLFRLDPHRSALSVMMHDDRSQDPSLQQSGFDVDPYFTVRFCV